MKIPREENALNELNVMCRESADDYDHASTLANDHQLAAVFKEIAAERRKISDILTEHIRQFGLPKFPDVEREGFHHLVTQVKAALVTDERQTLLNERLHAEREVAKLIVGALQENISEDLRTYLETTLTQMAKTQKVLSHFKAMIT